jgi:hypothetical protein
MASEILPKRPYRRRDQDRLDDDHGENFEEQPLIAALDTRDRDKLLEKLVKVHGAPRTDIAPQLIVKEQSWSRSPRSSA